MTDSESNTPADPNQPQPPPPPDPTLAMPATPGPGDVAPEGAVEGAVEEHDLARPWYKKPAAIVLMVVAALALLGLLLALFLSGDDDDGDVVSAKVVLVPKDTAGAGLDREYAATVTGTGEAPNSFVWLEPRAAPGVGGVVGSTGGRDRTTFSWAPAAEVTAPTEWTSTITLVEIAPAGFIAPGPVVECVLSRPDVPDTTISMSVVVDPPDPTVEQIVTYSFPNHEFLPNDTATCELVSEPLPPDATTTVPETTVPETTVPETTVPETTVPETTVPETTVPETTVPETTAPETTSPPTPPATATEALQAAGDYATFLSLASGVTAVQDLLDGSGPITVFAPTDAALAGVTPPADAAELERLLLSHIVDGEALDAATLFDGSRTEVGVASGGTQLIVASPPTIGGATVAQADLASTNGVSHGVGAVLASTP